MRSLKTHIMLMLATTALLVSYNTTAQAKQQCFYVGDGKDQVRFTSDAPVELIEGMTPKISGKVCYDDSFAFDAQHPFDANFQVDLKSLTTGIALRDDHMRDNFLHTQQYPYARFKATGIHTSSKPPFTHGQRVKLNATGRVTIHGKTVTKTVPLKVTYFDKPSGRFRSGQMIRIQGKFPVVLAQHGIKHPKVLAMKLADTVYVTIDAFGTAHPKNLK